HHHGWPEDHWRDLPLDEQLVRIRQPGHFRGARAHHLGDDDPRLRPDRRLNASSPENCGQLRLIAWPLQEKGRSLDFALFLLTRFTANRGGGPRMSAFGIKALIALRVRLENQDERFGFVGYALSSARKTSTSFA